MTCLFDFTWLFITVLLTERSSLHARQNNFPFEIVKHSSAYREFLMRCSGVTDFRSLCRFGPFERFFHFGGLRSITRFLANSDDVGRCKRERRLCTQEEAREDGVSPALPELYDESSVESLVL